MLDHRLIARVCKFFSMSPNLNSVFIVLSTLVTVFLLSRVVSGKGDRFYHILEKNWCETNSTYPKK